MRRGATFALFLPGLSLLYAQCYRCVKRKPSSGGMAARSRRGRLGPCANGSGRARAARGRDERLAHEMSASRTRKTARAQGRAARAREKPLAHKTSGSRTRKTARAEPEPFERSRSVSEEGRGLLLVYRDAGPRVRRRGRRAGASGRGNFPARGFFDIRCKFKPGQALNGRGLLCQTRGRAMGGGPSLLPDRGMRLRASLWWIRACMRCSPAATLRNCFPMSV